MRCVPECSFAMLPNNGPVLALHMQDCDLNGALKNVKDPVVVWRDGSFAVVSAPNEGERVYDIGFKRISHEIELPVLDIDLIDGVNVEPVMPVEVTSSVAIEVEQTSTRKKK